MWYYIAVDMLGDILFLDEGEQYDEPDGWMNNGYPPFYSAGGPLDVITVGMKHFQKCEKYRLGFISMN